MLADSYRTKPQKLAATSGVLFAMVNGGFAVGVALSGFLPPSLRVRYIAQTSVCVASFLCALSSLRESLPASERVAFRARAFNPFAFTRLLGASRTMRLLSVLSVLTLGPLFMGDTLQVFIIRSRMSTQPVPRGATHVLVFMSCLRHATCTCACACAISFINSLATT